MLSLHHIMLSFGNRKTSRFDGLVDVAPTPSTGSSFGDTSGKETLYKHYLQVIYTPVSKLLIFEFICIHFVFRYAFHIIS